MKWFCSLIYDSVTFSPHLVDWINIWKNINFKNSFDHLYFACSSAISFSLYILFCNNFVSILVIYYFIKAVWEFDNFFNCLSVEQFCKRSAFMKRSSNVNIWLYIFTVKLKCSTPLESKFSCLSFSSVRFFKIENRSNVINDRREHGILGPTKRVNVSLAVRLLIKPWRWDFSCHLPNRYLPARS